MFFNSIFFLKHIQYFILKTIYFFRMIISSIKTEKGILIWYFLLNFKNYRLLQRFICFLAVKYVQGFLAICPFCNHIFRPQVWNLLFKTLIYKSIFAFFLHRMLERSFCRFSSNARNSILDLFNQQHQGGLLAQACNEAKSESPASKTSYFKATDNSWQKVVLNALMY